MTRNLIPRPSPPLEVRVRVSSPLVLGWRSVEVPPGLADELRGLVAQVLVVRLEGPDGQQLPEDLVRLCTTNLARVDQEEHVLLRFPVDLEDHENAKPEVPRMIVSA